MLYSSPMKKTLSTFLFAGILLSLSACTKTPLNLPPLGPISATGTLIPAEVSLLRRGTHILMVNGKKMYYVESKTEDLISKEGQIVHVKGMAESNTTSSDLPVIVLETLESVQGDAGLKIWNIPALDIRLQAPVSWTATIQNGAASFSLPTETVPILVIKASDSDSLPANGTHTYQGGHRAVRDDGIVGAGKTDIFLEGKEEVLHLHFDSSVQKSLEGEEERKLVVSEFEYVLDSIKFLSDKEALSTGSGNSISTSCGGEGNVLCPQGSFCNVTDPQSNSGKCRSIKP